MRQTPVPHRRKANWSSTSTGTATSSRSCLTKETQAATRSWSPPTKRRSVKRLRKPRYTCPRTTADNRENSGPLEQQLPGREWAALAPEEFDSGYQRRRNYETAKVPIRISEIEIIVQSQAVGTASGN